MGNFCSFGPPNEPSPPSVRRVKPGEQQQQQQQVEQALSPPLSSTSSASAPQGPHKQGASHVDKDSLVTVVPTIPVNNSGPPSVVANASPSKATNPSVKLTMAADKEPAAILASSHQQQSTTQKKSDSLTLASAKETKATSQDSLPPATPVVIETKSKTLKTCAKCNKTITGTMVEAMNKEYHETCFVCGNCKGELAGRFAVIDGSPYCPSCAVAANKSRKGSQIKQSPNTSVSGGGSRIESPSRSGSRIESSNGSRIENSSSRSGSRIESSSRGGSRIESSGGSRVQTGQAGLLQWCKNRTQDYAGVEVKDFVKSWQDGLAFCALLHSYRPDLIDFNSLSSENKEKNIALAFQVAEKMEIPQLLDPEDFALEKLSMMTYLSAAYEKIGKVKVEN